MNLIEKYYSEPGNYIVEAGGGYGKSTSLKYLSDISFGREIQGKKEMTVYIPMAEFNLRKAQPGILFDYLKQFFSNEVTEKALLEMISDSKENIHYLFLLDGLNEIHNYEINGQTVMDFVCNDILRLLNCENVNIIISARIAEILPERIKRHFKLLVLQPLSNDVVSHYLGLENLSVIPGHIREMLENPMLLTIFKKLYKWIPEQAIAIDNKYELFELYFKQDIDIHGQEIYSDHLLTVRRYVIEKILPFVAFRVENTLLRNEHDNEKNRADLLEEACLNSGYPENVNFMLVQDVVRSLWIVDSDLCFTHEMFRDYFAAKGFVQAGQKGCDEETASFLERLTDWLEYRNDQRDLLRRTRFLDLADFIYSIFKSDLRKAMKSFGVRPEKRRCCLTESFYQELSGVYDDLSNGEEASKIGWIALDYLKISEQYFSPLIAAQKYSFLYYVVKWDKNEDENCYKVILYAKKILDQMDQSQHDWKYHELYGKVLSNIGSYYYKLGSESKRCGNQEKADDMFRKAEKWHRQAMDYRKEYCSVSAQAQSFRTLMSDAYQLRNYSQGYQYYCEAMDVLSPQKSLEENLMFRNAVIPEDLVERALGSEFEILNENSSRQLTEEILKNLPGQIRYIYEKSTESGRRNLKMLESLEGKLDLLKKCDLIKAAPNLLKIVDEYLKRCRSFH